MATSDVAYGIPTTSVVGDVFCVPYMVEFVVKKSCHGFFDSRFQVLDVNGVNLFLQVDGSCRNLQKKLVMRHPAGFPILTLREKVLSLRHRWTVHRGKSSEQTDRLFTVQRSHPLQMRTRLDVFLPAGNLNGDVSCFQVVWCYSYQSFRVYQGNNIIAEVNHDFKWENYWAGKDNFRVKIYPGVDYAFIVALLVILNENDMM